VCLSMHHDHTQELKDCEDTSINAYGGCINSGVPMPRPICPPHACVARVHKLAHPSRSRRSFPSSVRLLMGAAAASMVVRQRVGVEWT